MRSEVVPDLLAGLGWISAEQCSVASVASENFHPGRVFRQLEVLK